MLTSCVQGYITGIEKPGTAMLLLVAYYIVFRIPVAVILKPIFGLSGIWIAFIASHVLACGLAFSLLHFIRYRLQLPDNNFNVDISIIS